MKYALQLLLQLLLPLLLLFGLFSCANPNITAQLNLADSLFATAPDSAYTVINAIDPEDLRGDKQNAQYALLLTQAQYKNYEPIPNDSLIWQSVMYYNDNDTYKYGLSLYHLGAVHQDMGFNELAMDEYKQALATLAQSTDYKTRALINCNMGQLYYHQYFEQQAIQRFKAAEELFEKSGETQNLSGLYGYMGSSFRMANNYDSALLLYHKAYAIAKQYEDTTDIINTLNNITWLNLDFGNINEAKSTLFGAVAAYQHNEISPKQYLQLAKIAFAENKLDSAIYFLDQNRDSNLVDDKLRSQIAEAQGDYQQSLASYKKYHDATWELWSKRDSTRVDEIEKRYDQAQHIKEKEQIRRSYLTWVVISTLSICLAITILIILWIRYTKERRAYKDFIEALKTQPNDTPLPDLLRKQEARFREAIEKRLSLIGELITLSYEYKDRDRAFISKFNKLVASDPLNSEALNDIAEVVNNGYNGLIAYLKTTHPTLKDSELLICALTCVGFTSQQLFIILNAKTVETIYYQKNRINTKLGIHGDLRKNLLRMADQRGVKD